MKYTIGKFSQLTGLSTHTLRYYEKEGLINPKRDDKGNRYYIKQDLIWIEFIKQLKQTDMPIKEIKIYFKLRSIGDKTIVERRDMLLNHRKELDLKLIELKENISKLNDKIEFYNNQIKTKKP